MEEREREQPEGLGQRYDEISIADLLAQAALGRPDLERLAQLFQHFAEQGQRARL